MIWKKRLYVQGLSEMKSGFIVNLTHLDFNSKKFQIQSEMGMEKKCWPNI